MLIFITRNQCPITQDLHKFFGTHRCNYCKYLKEWCRGTELNRRHEDFQFGAFRLWKSATVHNSSKSGQFSCFAVQGSVPRTTHVAVSVAVNTRARKVASLLELLWALLSKIHAVQ